jgi:hypothetical protein
MSRVALVLLVAVFVPAAARGQSDSGIRGRVADATGNGLPGVSVQLRGERSAATTETVTDARGQYELRTLPGTREVRFSLINFSRVTRTVSVEANRLAVVDVVLSLALTADVTVTGRRTFRNLAEVENPFESLIGIADAASEGAITAKQIEGRPMVRPGDVLETVPGLVISQHSGEGKANQYYLRGFNLDHGTDFAVSVAGVPVNMPTHGHGQGYSDGNFLIPELVSGVQFKKGPYYADEGDFSTAGAANINYVNTLERPLLRVTGGGDRFGRLLAAAAPRLGAGHLLFAVETGTADGPWENPEDYKRFNGIVRYSRGDSRQALAVTFMGYNAEWTATDQIPERAVQEGVISRFGTVDPSDGGKTHRYTFSVEGQRSGTASTTKVAAFAMDYGLDLFSNYTYLLDDPVNGDQFEQVDRRGVFGLRANHRRRTTFAGRSLEHNVGVQARYDRIGPLGLFATRERRRLSTTREDRVEQASTGIFYQGELEITDRLRVSAGLRGDVYRFDVHSARPENSGTDVAALVSPKFGVVFAPSSKLELYGNYGYGYHSNDARGATITVDPATGEPTDRVTPLVRTRGGEVGIRSIVIPKLQTTVAVWGLNLDSELVFVGDAGTTEAGRPSRRFGVEWANYYSPQSWLTLDADLSMSSARFTDHDVVGAEIPGAVRRVASAGVSITDVHRWSGQWRLRYLGRRPLIEDGSVQAPRSMLFNAEAGCRIGTGTRLVVDVLNLFDAGASDIDYFYPSRLPGEPASGVDDIHTHPVSPRTVRISLRFDF